MFAQTREFLFGKRVLPGILMDRFQPLLIYRRKQSLKYGILFVYTFDLPAKLKPLTVPHPISISHVFFRPRQGFAISGQNIVLTGSHSTLHTYYPVRVRPDITDRKDEPLHSFQCYLACQTGTHITSDIGIASMAIAHDKDNRAILFRLPGNRIVLTRFIVLNMACT